MNDSEKPKNEYKFINLAELKASSDDDKGGGFKGYGNNFGILDSYDDITIKGCVKDSINEFLEMGFSAPDHRWGIGSEIGLIKNAYEDETGIFVDVAYHPTDDAQTIRQKVKNRMDNGKKVSLSIGYRTLESEYVVGEEAAPFLKNPSQEVLAYLKERQPFVRILKKIKLYEVSIVTIGANSHSEVGEAKSATSTREEIQAKRALELSGGNAKKLQILNLKLRALSL